MYTVPKRDFSTDDQIHYFDANQIPKAYNSTKDMYLKKQCTKMTPST